MFISQWAFIEAAQTLGREGSPAKLRTPKTTFSIKPPLLWTLSVSICAFNLSCESVSKICPKAIESSLYVCRHAQSCRLFATPWTVAHQAPLFMEFSRQEYWSGLPLPSPGYLPDPEIDPQSPAWRALPSDRFTIWATRENLTQMQKQGLKFYSFSTSANIY